MNYSPLYDVMPVETCMEPTIYDKLQCLPTIYGCTYRASANYDSSATTPACPRNGTYTTGAYKGRPWFIWDTYCYDGCYWDVPVRAPSPPSGVLPPRPPSPLPPCTLAPCTLHPAHRTPHPARCIPHTVHRTLHTAHRTLHIARCTPHAAPDPDPDP